MIVDHHTHTFPAAIAAKALSKLSASARMHYHNEGTDDALLTSMQISGVDRSILLPVATKEGQYVGINENAIRIHAQMEQTGLDSFGGIHPADENYKEILMQLHTHGIPGVKLHPIFQNVAIDDIRNKRIIDYANELGLWVTIHPGYDIGFPGVELSIVPRILHLIEEVHPNRLILAHLGGWNDWDAVESDLTGSDVYMDTSFSLTKVHTLDDTYQQYLSNEQFVRIVRKHGTDRIFLGSDNPWSTQSDAIADIAQSGLTKEETAQILEHSIYTV